MSVVSIITTTALCVFTLYFLGVVGARLRFYMKRGEQKKSKKKQRSREDSVIEETHPAIANGNDDTQTHPMFAFHAIAFAFLVNVLLRCIVYVALVALSHPPSQQGCDLMFQVVHLLYAFGCLNMNVNVSLLRLIMDGGLMNHGQYCFLLAKFCCANMIATLFLVSKGLVLFYAFVWRIQRHFYYVKIFRQFYTKLVQKWSWTVAVCIALVSAGRLMILMSGWRFGVQYLPEEETGCVTDDFNRIQRNVSRIEWDLPFTYNVACSIILFFLTGGLSLNLCIKSLSVKDSERLPEMRLSAIKKKLLVITVCSMLSLASTVISQVVAWQLLSYGLPAVLFNQIDDLATVVQVMGMVFCMDDWKFYFIPFSFCRRKKNIKGNILSLTKDSVKE